MECLQSNEYARKIRALSLELVHSARASHIGSALSISDLLAVLYSNGQLLNINSHTIQARSFVTKQRACLCCTI